MNLGYVPTRLTSAGGGLFLQKISHSKYSPHFMGPRTPNWWGRKKRQINARDESIIVRYRSGQTLQAIGDFFGITRERVRQLLLRSGVDPNDGGMKKRGEIRRASRSVYLEQKCLIKYGCDREIWRSIGAVGRRHFAKQRRSSKYRGVVWRLTLGQWWSIWQASGKYAERGRGGDAYCMARLNDDGPYELGNVHITTNRENAQEWRRSGKRANSGTRNGVYFSYPGYARPWVAKHGKYLIGLFRSEQEARRAKDSYVRHHSKKASHAKNFATDPTCNAT